MQMQLGVIQENAAYRLTGDRWRVSLNAVQRRRTRGPQWRFQWRALLPPRGNSAV
jgi:hypothetical protein